MKTLSRQSMNAVMGGSFATIKRYGCGNASNYFKNILIPSKKSGSK